MLRCYGNRSLTGKTLHGYKSLPADADGRGQNQYLLVHRAPLPGETAAKTEEHGAAAPRSLNPCWQLLLAMQLYCPQPCHQPCLLSGVVQPHCSSPLAAASWEQSPANQQTPISIRRHLHLWAETCVCAGLRPEMPQQRPAHGESEKTFTIRNCLF